VSICIVESGLGYARRIVRAWVVRPLMSFSDYFQDCVWLCIRREMGAPGAHPGRKKSWWLCEHHA
jgi:hypothetical protein